MKLFKTLFGKEEINKSEKHLTLINEENNYPIIDLEILKNRGILLIVGNSGSGVTSTARLISFYLIDKEYYQKLSVFSGFSTAFEYIFGNHTRYFHRSIDLDYPEVIAGEKSLKYIYWDITVNKWKEYIPPNIYLFDVRKFLDKKIYDNLIENFFLFFTEIQNQILVIDNIGNRNFFLENPKRFENLIRAGEKNLIIINIQNIESLKNLLNKSSDFISIILLRQNFYTKRKLINITNLIPENMRDEFLNLKFKLGKFQDIFVKIPQGEKFFKLPFICCYKDYKEIFGG